MYQKVDTSGLLPTTTIDEAIAAGRLKEVTGGGSGGDAYLAKDQTFSGTNTFSKTIVGSVNGNSATATKLATARKINRKDFDGTADITIDAGGDVFLANNQSFTVINTFTKTIKGSIDGNSATATNLETARRIIISGFCDGYATFDGSANVSISVSAGSSVGDETRSGNNTFTGSNSFNQTINGSISGGANTLMNARKIGITGDIVGAGVSFNGSVDINISVSNLSTTSGFINAVKAQFTQSPI